MNASVRSFLLRWAVTALGVLAATQIVPGVDCRSWQALAVAALVLGFLNAFVRPILTVLSLPLVLVTLGLFLWVINAALLGIVAALVKSFTVSSFWSALGGAAVISITSALANAALGIKTQRSVDAPGSSKPPHQTKPPGPGGPVIDV